MPSRSCSRTAFGAAFFLHDEAQALVGQGHLRRSTWRRSEVAFSSGQGIRPVPLLPM